MKKVFAIILCAVMVLSMIPALALSSSAANEGMWTTRRGIGGYAAGKENDYTAAPGYKYDAEGFHTIGADYTGTAPYFRVVSKEAVDMTQGFSMTLRIDEFAYKLDKNYDEWISFNLFSQMDMAPAAREEGSGNGIVTLSRGTGNGAADLEPFWQTANTHDEDGTIHTGLFDTLGNGFPNIEVPVDDDGRELYTLTGKFEDGTYTFNINGADLPANMCAKLAEICPDGQIFVGVTIQTGAPDSVCNVSIIDVNGSVPTGDDTAEPEENVKFKAPIIDSSTVPEGQPCLLWDATHTFQNGEPGAANCTMIAQGDGSYSLQAEVSNTCYFEIGPKGTLSYDQKDFPVIAMLMKDYWGNDGRFWYACGPILGANNDHIVSWSQGDDNAQFYGEAEEYVFVCADITDMLDVEEGARINGGRIEFSIDCTDSDMNAWYMNWLGYFRTVEDAKAYADAYMAKLLAEQSGEQDTEPAGDDQPGDDQPAGDKITDPTHLNNFKDTQKTAFRYSNCEATFNEDGTVTFTGTWAEDAINVKGAFTLRYSDFLKDNLEGYTGVSAIPNATSHNGVVVIRAKVSDGLAGEKMLITTHVSRSKDESYAYSTAKMTAGDYQYYVFDLSDDSDFTSKYILDMEFCFFEDMDGEAANVGSTVTVSDIWLFADMAAAGAALGDLPEPETKAPKADTEAPAADTKAPAADGSDAADGSAADGSDAAADDKGGCASVIGCAAIVLSAIAAAFVCKKH